MFDLRRTIAVGVVVGMVLAGFAGIAFVGFAGPVSPGSTAPATDASSPGESAESAPVVSTSAPTRVDSCTRITDPGVYVLAGNVTGANGTVETGVAGGDDTMPACIVIASSDVFLDGSGHVVAGNASATAAGNESTSTASNESTTATSNVSATAASNESTTAASNESTTASGDESVPEVDDGALADDAHSLGVGIAIRGANGSAVSNVTVVNATTSGWGVGASAANATGATFYDVHASGNANVGVHVVGGSDALFVESSADRNGVAGLAATGTRNLTVVESSFAGNDVVGVDASAGNAAPVFVDVSVSNSSVAGIAVVQSTRPVIADAAVANVGGGDSRFGVSASYLFVGASNATVLDSTTRDDGSWAVYATDCENAPGGCLPGDVLNTSGVARVTLSAVTVDTVPVSLIGRDVAVGHVDAFSTSASALGGLTVGDGVVVTNTTPSASVDLSTRWGRDRSVLVTETRFEVGNATGGGQVDDANITLEPGRVVVSGTTWGANACYTATLADVTYDASGNVLTVTVESTERTPDEDGACAQVITEIPYRAVVSIAGTPDTVEVVHVHDGERTVVASTANDSTTGADESESTTPVAMISRGLSTSGGAFFGEVTG
jgi:hypothetical protein